MTFEGYSRLLTRRMKQLRKKQARTFKCLKVEPEKIGPELTIPNSKEGVQ